MLRGITKDQDIMAGGIQDESETVKKLNDKIRQLNSQFKYYNDCKVFPNFVKLEGAGQPLRLEFTQNKKYVFVGGIGSKIIKRNLRDFNDKKFSKGCKRCFDCLVYDAYGLVVDCKDRAWIHEASTNKLIGFD